MKNLLFSLLSLLVASCICNKNMIKYEDGEMDKTSLARTIIECRSKKTNNTAIAKWFETQGLTSEIAERLAKLIPEEGKLSWYDFFDFTNIKSVNKAIDLKGEPCLILGYYDEDLIVVDIDSKNGSIYMLPLPELYELPKKGFKDISEKAADNPEDYILKLHTFKD